MVSYSLQRQEGTELSSRPINEEAYQAALAIMARPVPPPAAALVELPEASADVVLRILVDIPPFVDAHEKTWTLRAGDLATLPQGTADILLRRRKAEMAA